MNEKRSASRSVWIVFTAVFVLYLLYADSLYHGLSGHSYVIKLRESLPLSTRGDLGLRSVFDYEPVNNTFTEGIRFRGEFNEVSDRGGNAKVRVFLRSPDALYEVIKNRRSFWAHSMKIAVNFFVSTAGLEKGIYQIGLYVSDDKGERFAWMDQCFEKNAGGPVIYRPRPVATVPTVSGKDMMVRIEKHERIKDDFVLQGWVIHDDTEMSDYNAFVKIKDGSNTVKVFYAPLFARTDISTGDKDPRTANRGFKLKIPLSELPPYPYTISVVLQSRKTGKAIESASERHPFAGISLASVIEQPPKESKKLNVHIDSKRKLGQYLAIKGWAYADGQETLGQQIYIQLDLSDGKAVHYSTSPIQRTDVGDHFKNSLYNESGFIALIPLTDGMDTDTHTMRIVVKNKTGMYKSAIFR